MRLVYCVFSLTVATTAWAGGPCPSNVFGSDEFVFNYTSGGTSQIIAACVGTSDDATNITYQQLSGVPLAASFGAVSANIPLGSNSFATVMQNAIQVFSVDGKGELSRTGGGHFSTSGGAVSGSGRGLVFRFPATNETVSLTFPNANMMDQMRSEGVLGNGVSNCVSVQGFLFCKDASGNLFQPNQSLFGETDYSNGRVYFPIAQIVAYGNRPYVSSYLANSSMLYALTPNTPGTNHTGTLLALQIDGLGNIVQSTIWATHLDVPNDGVSRLAVGSQGIYLQADPSEIFIMGFHTVVTYKMIMSGAVGQVFSAFATLPAGS